VETINLCVETENRSLCSGFHRGEGSHDQASCGVFHRPVGWFCHPDIRPEKTDVQAGAINVGTVKGAHCAADDRGNAHVCDPTRGKVLVCKDSLPLNFSPLATELPEIMNAVIWVRQGKERLALANISGAMMIQATISTAFGLFFTPWRLETPLLIAAGVTALAIIFLQWTFRSRHVNSWRLVQVGWLYVLFAGLLSLPGCSLPPDS
jgi:hypothetical protein